MNVTKRFLAITIAPQHVLSTPWRVIIVTGRAACSRREHALRLLLVLGMNIIQGVRMLQIGLKLAKIALLAISGADQTKIDLRMVPPAPGMPPKTRPRAQEHSVVVTRRNLTILSCHVPPALDVALMTTIEEPTILVMTLYVHMSSTRHS